ncbi:hypothetical protein ABT065_24260 [Streptomyces sp. NPDC002764]|uniref:hypothetical protein n=1 Tax=Streptomyces sp. NPDC002764 TaxID=3154428 RepID=UPI00333454B9
MENDRTARPARRGAAERRPFAAGRRAEEHVERGTVLPDRVTGARPVYKGPPVGSAVPSGISALQ